MKLFYGPLQRKMGGVGFIRLGVWQNFMRAWRSGYQGNMNGEGFILGGVFVIGPGNQGILLEHREKEFGDKVHKRVSNMVDSESSLGLEQEEQELIKLCSSVLLQHKHLTGYMGPSGGFANRGTPSR
ncbi:unnamed protein product [Pleuronectes platessa]|uniref:Peroxiredoxin-like 2A n=1 Tax=Pleuronectes platessa TaxID=8262 RepID=A0A9N7V7T8_PLEPL|nr:unnamed protein product [Pleuronectes platessa]